MLFDASAPLPNPVQLQARLAAVMSMLEAQHSAVERLQGERDGLRVERDTFRVERDAANAEVEEMALAGRPAQLYPHTETGLTWPSLSLA